MEEKENTSENTNEDILDEALAVEQDVLEKEKEEQNFADMEVKTASDDEDLEEELSGNKKIVVELDSESIKEKKEKRGVKAMDDKLDGKTAIIKKIDFTSPKTFDQKGNPLPPTKAQNSDKTFYPIKMKIWFDGLDEQNIVEYYPGINLFINDGKICPRVRISADQDTTVSQIMKMFVCKKAEKEGKKFKLVKAEKNKRLVWDVVEDRKAFIEYSESISTGAFISGLIGAKVKLKMSSGIYNKRAWKKFDIDEILYLP